MADRRPRNSNAIAYKTKQTKTEAVFFYQASSSKSQSTARAPRQGQAPAKKPLSRVTKPQTRKPTVKQLVNKVNSQSKKMDQMKKQINDVKKLVQTTKKKTTVQKKKQPIKAIVDRKIIIQDKYYK